MVIEIGENGYAIKYLLRLASNRTGKNYCFDFVSLFNCVFSNIRQKEFMDNYVGKTGQITPVFNNPSTSYAIQSISHEVNADINLLDVEKQALLHNMEMLIPSWVTYINSVMFGNQPMPTIAPNKYNFKATRMVGDYSMEVIEDINYINGFSDHSDEFYAPPIFSVIYA